MTATEVSDLTPLTMSQGLKLYVVLSHGLMDGSTRVRQYSDDIGSRGGRSSVSIRMDNKAIFSTSKTYDLQLIRLLTWFS